MYHNHINLRYEPRITNFTPRLTSFTNSFYPSTITAWNNLPQSTVDSESVSIFKHKFKPKPSQSAKYYTHCSGRPGIWLTRLRLGLSALKAHRFRYNLIDDPFCDFCGNQENTKHYMFDCAAYTQQRTLMLNKLQHIHLDTTNKNTTTP